jgi:hypothetical protein
VSILIEAVCCTSRHPQDFQHCIDIYVEQTSSAAQAFRGNGYGNEAKPSVGPSTYNMMEGYTSAQYPELRVNESYLGALICRYGNLNLVRVHHAEHGFSYAQPRTSYGLSNRGIIGLDLTTSTKSPTKSWTV